MQAKLIFFALSASVVFGQAHAEESVTRVFRLHHIDKEQDLNEFATMVRTVSDLRDVKMDAAQKSMSVSGTPAQIATAEWLFTELDRQTLPGFSTKEFKVPNKEDDSVRVFFLRNAATVRDFQEQATAIRTITDMRQAFTFYTPRALAVRGTVDQIAATEWMIHELDQPADAKRTNSREYQMIDRDNRGDTAVRVFYLPYTSTLQSFQEVATLVRTIVEVRRVFTYNAPKALVVRGTPEAVALAAWFTNELGKPIAADAVASQTYRYDPENRGENIVRLFYVKDTATVAAFQQLATQIRTATQIRRVFTYNETRALAVRGTAEQVAMAEQMLQDRAQQIASK
jgi:hypothetical protein